MLDVGAAAPDFELPDQNGDLVSLSDYRGQKVVLWFYPRANTEGCTMEACSFRDNWDAFEERDIAVLGVSNDPVEDLAAFTEKYDLPFTLLSDGEGAVATAYDSYGTRELGGETHEIAFRNTYVIGPDGTISHVYEDVTPEAHAEEILADLD